MEVIDSFVEEKSSLVSVIMPTFNSVRFIEQAINSVLAQTYKNWQLLIVDGRSTDGTRELVRGFSEVDDRIFIVDNEYDKGPAQARALGIAQCRGELVAFLDSDDLWAPSKLQKQIDFMNLGRAGFVFSDYKLISEAGQKSTAIMYCPRQVDFRGYLRQRGIANSAVLVRKEWLIDSVLGEVGGRYAEDTLWWLLVLQKGRKAYCVPEPLMYYRRVADSRSANVLQNQISVWKFYRKELSLSALEATVFYVGYVLDVLWRRASFKLQDRGFIND